MVDNKPDKLHHHMSSCHVKVGEIGTLVDAFRFCRNVDDERINGNDRGTAVIDRSTLVFHNSLAPHHSRSFSLPLPSTAACHLPLVGSHHDNPPFVTDILCSDCVGSNR